jgi:hypothetical protein
LCGAAGYLVEFAVRLALIEFTPVSVLLAASPLILSSLTLGTIL